MKISQKFVCILLLGLLIFASANTVSSDQNKGDIGKDSILNNDSELCKFLFYDNKGTSIKVVFPEELINIIDIEKTVESNNEVSWSDTEQIFILNEEHNGAFKIWFKERITKDYIIQVIDKENKESFKLKKDEVQICKDVLDTEELKDKKTDSDTALEEINSETSDNSKSTGKQEDGVSEVQENKKREHTVSQNKEITSIDRKSQNLSSLIESDERNGWSIKKTGLNNWKLKSGSTLEYGFGKSSNIFTNTVQLKDSNGNIINYRSTNDTGNYKGIRIYTNQADLIGSSTKELPTVKINTVLEKNGEVRAYGEMSLKTNAVWTYQFLVTVTLTPNNEKQNININYNFIRVDQPISDLKPFKEPFYILTDIELNNHSIGKGYYIGENKGIFFRDESYQVNLTPSGSNSFQSWDVGEDSHIDWSIGIHWPLRPSDPSDFFKGGVGKEKENGNPSQLIVNYNATVAMKWDSEKIQPGKNREISYDIMLDSLVKPEIKVNSYKNILRKNTNLDLSGAAKGSVSLFYRIDDGKSQKININSDKDWLLSLPVGDLDRGKHYITLVSQNERDINSDEVKLPFRIVDEEDKWIIDTEVQAIKGDLDNLHLGDELQYTITLETLNLDNDTINHINWEYDISNSLEVVNNQVLFSDRVSKDKVLSLQNNKINTGDFVIGRTDTAKLKFNAVLGKKAYGVRVSDISNYSIVKNRENKKITEDTYALTGNQIIKNHPQLSSVTEISSSNKDNSLEQDKEFYLTTKIKNNAINYNLEDDESGNVENLIYTIDKLEGLQYNEVQISKNGKIVGDDVASVEIQTSATKQEGNEVYIKFNKPFTPQDEFDIKITGKISDIESLSPKDIINLKLNGRVGATNNEETINYTEKIHLPKLVPKGKVWIDSVKDSINLGEIKRRKEEQKVYTNELKVDIKDTRSDNQNWKLSVSAHLTSVSNSQDELPIYYENNSLKNSVEIMGKGDQHLDFSKKIYTIISPGSANGRYEGVINWELKDTP
ncbi:hypothetical protein [Lactococcus formosensis]|uniref:hypothetical protein n=1 Tax=Lactococcus formosensis TaxID=1281486 RepID=UPI00254B9A09|nr:hypothetical protein [Lactococcus formosensis]